MPSANYRIPASLERPITETGSLSERTGGGFQAVQSQPVLVAIEPSGASEFNEDGQTRAPVSHTVHMHYRPGVAPSWRLVLAPDDPLSSWHGRVLHIDSVVDVGERRRTLQLSCFEIHGEDLDYARAASPQSAGGAS